MISGRNSDTTYEQTENLKPGKTSSVTAAPPSTCLRSSTRTFLPARARYAAFTRPLCPPPITTASYLELMIPPGPCVVRPLLIPRSEEHTSELQSPMYLV